jgi:hypothetical protein
MEVFIKTYARAWAETCLERARTQHAAACSTRPPAEATDEADAPCDC